MRISVIGCGYLGATHAVAMASLGHDVVGVDVDEKKVAALGAGTVPFFEPGLAELLEETLATGRLAFTTKVTDAADAAVHFVCVGTPQQAGAYAADLTAVEAAFSALESVASATSVVVGKSTVPVGTAARLAARLEAARPGCTLVWNPEFLREGFAVQDTLRPDRIVYGVPTSSEEGRAPTAAGLRAAATLDAVYETALAAKTPRIVTDYATAELVKVAANSFLATKISFINAMAELCEVAGGDITHLADAIGYDQRIGRAFLNAGLGFGGGCLPKDIRAFIARAEELHAEPAVSFLREIDSINLRRRERMVEVTVEILGGRPLAGARIAVLGAAFKPHSDDVRDSPALRVAASLHDRRADVVVTDPRAVANARQSFPHLTYAETTAEALDGADAVLLLTEWPEYRELDPAEAARRVRHPRIVDGRNALSPERWRTAGWTYRALGRP